MSNKTRTGNLSVVDNKFDENSAVTFHNTIIEQEAEKFKKEKVLDKASEIVDRKESLEIIPANIYVLIKPYDINPYQKISVSDGGIALNTYDSGNYMSQETGEMEKSTETVKVGTVIEISPEAKFVKEGDDVFFKTGAAVPVPFFKLGMCVVAETSILAIVSEKLKERFNK